MNLATSGEQQELQASARRFLEKEITRERLLAWDKTAEGYDPAFWRAMVELGWLGFSLPESSGGGGARLLDLALVVGAAGFGPAGAAGVGCAGGRAGGGAGCAPG